MKVVLLKGSPRPHGNTDLALCEVAKALNAEGIDTEVICVGNKPIRGCIACGKCHETGKCVFDDGLNELADRICEADGLIVGSPVYYAGMAGGLKAFLDRLFYTQGRKLMFKPAAGVVCARRGGTTATYDELNKYFGINCMPIVSSTYWNQVHGREQGEAEQDAEGMRTMRTLGRNMAWMLKLIELGKQNGLEHPAPESGDMTNFIR